MFQTWRDSTWAWDKVPWSESMWMEATHQGSPCMQRERTVLEYRKDIGSSDPQAMNPGKLQKGSCYSE